LFVSLQVINVPIINLNLETTEEIYMKKIILFLALIVPAVCVWAQTDAVSVNLPAKGYRGFVDLSGEALFEKKYSNDRDIVYSISGFNTTHGYQFNENFFVGGGIGINFMTYNFMNDGARFAIDYPLFITGRADWKIGKVPLFADLRLGTFAKSSGDYNSDKFFINPSIGYRCSWGRRVSLNFGAGLSMHWLDGYGDGEWKMMPSVKIGIEFH